MHIKIRPKSLHKQNIQNAENFRNTNYDINIADSYSSGRALLHKKDTSQRENTQSQIENTKSQIEIRNTKYNMNIADSYSSGRPPSQIKDTHPQMENTQSQIENIQSQIEYTEIQNTT